MFKTTTLGGKTTKDEYRAHASELWRSLVKLQKARRQEAAFPVVAFLPEVGSGRGVRRSPIGDHLARVGTVSWLASLSSWVVVV